MGGIHRPTTQLGVHDPSAWATTGTITTGIANQRGLTPLNSPEVFLEPTDDGVPERCVVTLDNIATVEQMDWCNGLPRFPPRE
jgi:hypothetical protein